MDRMHASKPTTAADADDDTDDFRDWDLVYHLGMERGLFSIDSEWLLLRLGPDGRVADARVNTD